jgi:hypothetical protein
VLESLRRAHPQPHASFPRKKPNVSLADVAYPHL